MARYIKANPKVAAFLRLTNDRNTVKDGNYLLWQGDMLAFGPLTRLPEILEQIGGIALMPHEAREEQDGTVTRPLPIATDPRFIIETAPVEGVSTETVEEPTQQPESPAESEETPASGETEGGTDGEENNEPDNAD